MSLSISYLVPRRRPCSLNSWVGAAVSVALLLGAGTAGASPGYPQIVYDETDSACAPPCTLCHETIRGGWETATKPFAQSLMHEGLVGDDEASLRVALRHSIADSDGDGMNDLDALRAGVDPSDGSQSLCPIEAGCTVPPSRSGPVRGLWTLLAVCLVLGWRRVRTARSAKMNEAAQNRRNGLT